MKYLKLSIFMFFLSANLLAQENITVQAIAPDGNYLKNNYLKLRITNNNTNAIKFKLGMRFDDGNVYERVPSYYFAKVSLVTGSPQQQIVISDTLYFGRDVGSISDFKTLRPCEFYEIPVKFNSDNLPSKALFTGLYNDYNSAFGLQFVVHLKYMYFGNGGMTIEQDFTSQWPSVGLLYNAESVYGN